MKAPTELVSPRQVARAIGASESSLKRWCDQGLIPTVLTAGGHRKIRIAAAIQFVRDRQQALVAPELLSLPPFASQFEASLTRGAALLADALLAGDDPLARRVILDLYLARQPLSVVCDTVIAAAFREIGDRWACNTADAYQERRGCEIAARALVDARRYLPEPNPSWLAMGGTIEGDLYTLPSIMAEIVLDECGFRAMSLGTSLPIKSLIRAVQDARPTLFWLSVSHIHDGLDFAAEYAALSHACRETGAALVVGGRALTEELRRQMTYSAYCDTMQQLEMFAGTLARSLPRNAPRPAAAQRVKRSPRSARAKR